MSVCRVSVKLPISRLQRDLTDSTMLRNAGVPLSHTLIAIKSIQKGLGKLIVNREKISRDLENNWMVISEGIQTILRREGFPEPYELLKSATRGKSHWNQEDFKDLVNKLDVPVDLKKELLRLHPATYLGED